MSDPIDIADRRARIREKAAEEDCNAWAPADLLRSMLHRIAAGEISPSGMMVLWAEKGDGATKTCMRRASFTVIESLGLMEAVKFDLLADTTVEV